MCRPGGAPGELRRSQHESVGESRTGLEARPALGQCQRLPRGRDQLGRPLLAARPANPGVDRLALRVENQESRVEVDPVLLSEARAVRGLDVEEYVAGKRCSNSLVFIRRPGEFYAAASAVHPELDHYE